MAELATDVDPRKAEFPRLMPVTVIERHTSERIRLVVQVGEGTCPWCGWGAMRAELGGRGFCPTCNGPIVAILAREAAPWGAVVIRRYVKVPDRNLDPDEPVCDVHGSLGEREVWIEGEGLVWCIECIELVAAADDEVNAPPCRGASGPGGASPRARLLRPDEDGA